MLRSTSYVFLLACLASGTWATEGVKGGGHRPQFPPTGGLNQYGAVNNTMQRGLCYKTIPYNHALALNASGNPYNTIPSQPQDNQGRITILDCCDGYIRNQNTGDCEPHCEQGCYGGQCTGPNICTCQHGWRPEAGVCMPVCERPCQKDAYCFSPNVCACKLGYDEVNGECKPICPGGCTNGECVAPRVCRCNPGFTLNQRQECIPAYECQPGYSRDVNGRCSRVPEIEETTPRQGYQCRNGCGPNGSCIGPDQCYCEPGFRVDPATGRCVSNSPFPTPSNPSYPTSLCDHDCGPNSMCIGQNQCVCLPDYRRDPVTGRCVSRFEPICELPCMNGDCTGPNQCTCKHGYSLSPNDPTGTRCVPVCIGGCPNGVCTAPNFCLCNHGYVKDVGVKGRTRCVPAQITTYR